MITQTKIELKEILDLLPNKTSLVYVDYRDSLDEALDLLQECIKEGNDFPIGDKIFDWYIDSEFEAIEYYKKELKKDLENKFNISKEGAEDIIEKNNDYISDHIHDRCDDDTVKDLLKNTSKQVIFYDLDLEVEADSWNWDKRTITKWRNELKRKLKIKIKTYDNDIDQMLCQASYGGKLVIYFYVNVEDLLPNYKEKNDWKTISFTNPYIAIIDNYNGSGDHCYLNGHSLSLPFNRENLFIDKLVPYNYTYQVCGMSSDWCEETEVGFSYKGIKGTINNSSTSAFLEKEEKLDKIFREGGCTTGDMNYKRHRNMEYINEFPCGSRCKSCGQFFID